MLLDVQRFDSFDGTKLAYEVMGDGPPVLLLHGIVVDSYINFIRPGVAGALETAGFQAVMYDQRGHGESDKPHDPAAYGGGAMEKDVAAFLDHLGVERCAFVGYSMGAMIGMHVIPGEPRVVAAVLGGVGANTLRRHETGGASPIAEAMLAPDKGSINPAVRSFRDFADLVGSDKEAIAAAASASGFRDELDPSRIAVPTLVLCGDNDPLAGDPAGLAEKIPGATSKIVGGSHLNVVNNPQFQVAVVDFLRDSYGT
jgi:pimeloyl-ACP methyl ester carboxylesterase